MLVDRSGLISLAAIVRTSMAGAVCQCLIVSTLFVVEMLIPAFAHRWGKPSDTSGIEAGHPRAPFQQLLALASVGGDAADPANAAPI